MSSLEKINWHLLVCEHKTCLKQGGRSVAKELKRALKDNNLQKQVLVTKVDCLDQCGCGPIVVVYPDGVWYGEVAEECAREIIERHVKRGEVVQRIVLRTMRNGESDNSLLQGTDGHQE